jgi:hypothetical protein
MPSSPKASSSPSSSIQQAARVAKHSSFNDNLYQTVYTNGRRCCIVESRRRSRLVRGSDPREDRDSHHRSALKCSDAASPELISVNTSLGLPSSMVSSPYKSEGLASSRDKYAKPSFNTPKAVIIVPTSSKPCAVKSEKSTSKRWVEPTPPPTPLLGRLPSPDLPDLVEAPFCDCDEAALVTYCMACKKKADHLVG